MVAADDHAGHPEEHDFRCRHEVIGGVVIGHLVFFVKAIEHLNGPNPRTEPRVHDVFVLAQVVHGQRSVAGFCTRLLQRFCLGARHYVLLFAFPKEPRRNLMSPPQLAADAPVLHVFHPVTVAVFEFGRVELHGVIHHRIQRRLRQFFHRQEPLQRQTRLDHGIGALAASHLVGVVLNLHEVAKPVQFLGEFLPAFKPVHPFVGPSICGHGAISVDGVDGFEAVLLTEVVVVGVVGRCHLQATRPKFNVDVIVGNDRHLTVHHRNERLLAHEVLVAFVVWVHANGRVSHDRLRSRCGHRDPTVFFPHNGVAHVVQLAVLFGVDDLFVAQRRQCHGVPVDHAHAAINQSFFMELHEGVNDAFVVALVHGEACAVPIAARPKLLELLQDDASVLMRPLPCMLEKLISGQV